jgi:hypothetical protein
MVIPPKYGNSIGFDPSPYKDNVLNNVIYYKWEILGINIAGAFNICCHARLPLLVVSTHLKNTSQQGLSSQGLKITNDQSTNQLLLVDSQVIR